MKAMSNRILVVDDEKSLRATFQAFLLNAGYEVETAASYQEALAILDQKPCDVILSDILLGGQSGIDLLRELKQRSLDLPVIMVTGYPNMDTAVESIRLDAFDYLAKPVTKHDLLRVAAKALRFKELQDQNATYQAHIEGIFRSAREGLLTLDPQGVITACNAAARQLLGMTGTVIGEEFSAVPELADPLLQSLLQKTLREQKSTSATRHEVVLDEKTSRILSLDSSPLRLSGGQFAGGVLVLRDETRVMELERNLQDRQHFHQIVGKSRAMQKVYDLIDDLTEVPTTVLIMGESGTGKELVADALHFMGPRQQGPLVKVNCAALSDSLLESELFGHVRGAFTGAMHNRIGRFQKANGGTILLDEIGDISPQMQLRLLRVLQEKQIEKVGDEAPINIDVRVLAATNQDLGAKVRNGEFRQDLYYRLNVVLIHLPPLRERREDIPMLVEHICQRLNKELNRQVEALDDTVMDLLLEYDWPGNVRELQHILEHAFIRCRKGRLVLPEHLPAAFLDQQLTTVRKVGRTEDNEPGLIREALGRAGGNKAKAARLLGIDRKTLYRKLEKYSLRPDELEAK